MILWVMNTSNFYVLKTLLILRNFIFLRTNSFSMFEAKYIQGEAKTLEEVMQERLEQKKAEEEAQEEKNSEALINYP